MSDRKAELERKKQRLEQMRKERQEKERARSTRQTDEAPKPAQSQDLRAETDELLKDLGIPPSGPKSSSPSPTHSNKSASDTEAKQVIVTTSRKPKVKLSVAKVSETSIPPKENVSYSKETQTAILEPLDKEENLSDGDSSRRDEDGETDSMAAQPQTPTSSKMPHVEMVAPKQTQEDLDKKEEKPVPELSEEEKLQILNSEDFQTFFSKSARLVERMLTEEVDIYTDYSGGDNEGKDDESAGDRLKLNRIFYDERWSKHRTNTSLDWSKQHPELLLASYNTNEDSPHDPDGVALIWNMKFKKQTPEYVFHCQSAIMSSCFAEFHPNLIVGGTYSGQIVLWDNRVNKRTPIQRTPLSAAAHTHPVYCVNVVGTQNAHNLISVSTDGKMCSWSLDMLAQPQDSMELHFKQSKSVAVTCFSFLSGDVNNFVVGSEECTVYTACRHGSKAGISEGFEGHHGPITGIDCHKVPGQIDFSPYFLTSSFDWTIKLWSIKEQKFLHSFEDNSDYIYDVKWSPTHPALFASADGNGKLDLWNLNNDTEVPTTSITIDNNACLNHVRWHETGSHIAAGDDIGRIHLYDVAETVAAPKGNEWSKFAKTLQEMKQQATEREEEAMSLSTMTSPLR
ncbi:cytoplasmic dynein 1 intermediate chain 2-like isoform X10 [Mytilus galloprovincialis]|uniref:cytoplasmic dynein 1 intermediate chain 2-like isoform X10 n=1 Tax=Mytilus galloprovincialis TaxID=29158 RepID=UPI003F7BEB6C